MIGSGTRELLARLYAFFHPDNDRNPLRQSMDWSLVRLNLAGGEPLLYPRQILEILPVARDLGFDVSLITNGSRLNPRIMASMAPSITLLGLSVDSPIARNNEEIGRIYRRGYQLDIAGLAVAVDEGQRRNPLLRVKVNTVVNKVTQSDDMTDVI